MNHQHTVRVTETLEALGVELADFTADVKVNLIPESGDGFNEPRERAYAELSKVTQVEGPHIPPDKLGSWAELWVDANQEQIWSDVPASGPF
jgi:hypothetical protein